MAFCSNILFAELFFTNLAVLSTANIYRHLPSLSETSERKLKDSALETIRSRYRIGDRSTTWSLHYRDTLVWPTWSIRADRTDVNNSVRRNVLKGKTKKKTLKIWLFYYLSLLALRPIIYLQILQRFLVIILGS